MAEQNVNLIVKQEEQHDSEEIVLSLSAIIRKLKKYFMVWLLIAILVGGLITGISVFFSTTSSTPVRAVVSFNYDGIEKGQNPDGTDFDWNSLKNPQVIQSALIECDKDLSLVESVRAGIVIEGAIPQDAWHRLNTYQDIYANGSSGQLNAATAMLDTSWVSTQYNITFNYGKTGLSRSDAVQVLNAMLDAYRDYFFEKFGYNEALGSSLAALNYQDYDYGQAVDLFRTTLNSLNEYVAGLSENDTARFRSTVTGYSFADLTSAITTLQTMDLSMVSAYQKSNNITKDREQLIAYYQDRIDTLERQQSTNKETLAAIEKAFDAYEKDQVIVFGEGNTGTNTQATVQSETYDELANNKVETARQLAKNKEDIAYYKACLSAVKANTSVSKEKLSRIDKDLEKLSKKVSDLIDLINDTANDYYQNVSLSDAYNILVPATSSVEATVTSGISKATVPLIGVEALLLVLYVGTAFLEALIEETRKRRKLAAATANTDNADSAEAAEQPASEEAKQ